MKLQQLCFVILIMTTVIAIISGVVILTIFYLQVTPINAQNYCEANLCSRGKHIACGNLGKFAETCPANAWKVTFNETQSYLVVRSHNTKRNQLAGGNLNGFSPAERMATMRWNKELATLAGLNVLQCAMKHDTCRNTKSFKSSGQNLAHFSYTGSGTSMDTYINHAIDAWWREYNVTEQSHLNKYPRNYKGSTIGHFTVMARDSNTDVGCAASTYKEANNWSHVLIACNYATTNWINSATYVIGPAASGCGSSNPHFQNLCGINEVYTDL